jgi:UDP-glucose:(heptosyl)LPS alpha-1,3-glucosyltransferase
VKIALAHKRFDLRGGAEWVLYHTARGLYERGHEVHLFCQAFRSPPPPGVIAHRVPGLAWPRTARLLTFSLWAPKFIAKYHCDVLMSFDRMIAQDVFRSGGGPHKTFIEKMMRHGGLWRKLWYRVNPYHRLALWIEKRQVGGGSRKIIALSNRVKEEFIQAYGVAGEKIAVVYNGVDHQRFHPGRRAAARNAVRSRLGIVADAPIVLFVGSGFRRKGLDRALRLWADDQMRGIYLVIVGNDANLASYQRQYAWQTHIIFTGARSDVEEFYGAADILILLSLQEGFGNVVLEAFAAGLPVVMDAGIGAAEVVEGDLREGIVNNSDDPGELKNKILKILEPERRDILSRQARQIAEKYSWSAYVNGVEQILNECSAYPAAVSARKQSVIPHTLS